MLIVARRKKEERCPIVTTKIQQPYQLLVRTYNLHTLMCIHESHFQFRCTSAVRFFNGHSTKFYEGSYKNVASIDPDNLHDYESHKRRNIQTMGWRLSDCGFCRYQLTTMTYVGCSSSSKTNHPPVLRANVSNNEKVARLKENWNLKNTRADNDGKFGCTRPRSDIGVTWHECVYENERSSIEPPSHARDIFRQGR